MAVLFLFQNCGKAKHEYKDDLALIVGPKSHDALVLLDQARQNTGFRVALQGEEFFTGTQYYWSGFYGDGSQCSVQAAADGTSGTFTCNALGAVSIHLAATDTNGKLSVYRLDIVVGDGVTGTQPPNPTPSPAPVPVPMPTPAPMGATLYANDCAGCHGPLATSSKRGILRSQLDRAIILVNAMSGLTGLSSADRDAIVAALQ